MIDINERDRLLLDWREKKNTLEFAKNEEMKARKLVVDLLHDPAKTGSTETTNLGHGYKLKIKVPVHYTFIKDTDGKIDREMIETILQDIENEGDEGILAAENLIRWKPELALTEYKNLPDKYRTIFDNVLITSEGAPIVELIEP